MKKILFTLPIVALLAFGCNSLQQTSSQTPVAPNRVPTLTPSPTPTLQPSAVLTPTPGPTLSPILKICEYAAPPRGCNYINGPNYNSTTNCGMMLSCPTPTPTPTPVPTSVNIIIGNFAFRPAAMTVKKGTTVIWTNQDSAIHTVTADNSGPSSGSLANGNNYSFTFNQAGTFSYHCSIHPSMIASVTVTQ